MDFGFKIEPVKAARPEWAAMFGSTRALAEAGRAAGASFVELS